MWQLTVNDNQIIEVNLPTTKSELKKERKEIIDILFQQGEIKGITAHQLLCFVQSRLNECMKELDMPKYYEVKYDPISNWFYQGINNYQFK